MGIIVNMLDVQGEQFADLLVNFDGWVLLCSNGRTVAQPFRNERPKSHLIEHLLKERIMRKVAQQVEMAALVNPFLCQGLIHFLIQRLFPGCDGSMTILWNNRCPLPFPCELSTRDHESQQPALFDHRDTRIVKFGLQRSLDYGRIIQYPIRQAGAIRLLHKIALGK